MGDGKSVFIVLAVTVIVGLTIIAAFDAPHEFVFACGNHSPAHTVLGNVGTMQELTEQHGCELWRVAPRD